MIVVYNGTEDWEGEIWLQDLFPNLPEKLCPFVSQFRVFVINLRCFRYGHLPGKPETRAIAESMMRATDGTFIEHLPGVFKHLAESSLGEPQRLGLTQNTEYRPIALIPLKQIQTRLSTQSPTFFKERRCKT